MSYRTNICFGHGHDSRTELPEIPGIVARRTELTEDPGTGMNVPHTELTKVSGSKNARVNAHPLGGEFDSKRRIQSNVHGMFSLGQ